MLKKFLLEAPVFTVFLLAQLPLLVALILIGYWILPVYLSKMLIAYLISLVFVGGAMWVWVRFWTISSRNFIKVYYTTTLVRFSMVILLLYISLSTIKFEQMFFTVNFIISYLYQSVIELLLIHHRLLKHPLEE